MRPRSPAPAAVGPASDPQQLLVRRVVAAGVGLLVVVLLVLGVRGCLNSRKEQSLKDYNRDVGGLIKDANTTTEDFFDTLTSGGSSSTGIQSEINQLRFRAQAQTREAEQIDVPAEMSVPHRNVLLSLSLVHEAMGRVAAKIPLARSTDAAAAEPAVKGIAGEMQAFVSANVVHNRRVAPLVKQVLDEHEIGGQTIESASFIENFGWLQPSTVAKRIGADAATAAGDGGTSEPAPGLHGHGLVAVTVGDATLQPNAPNSIRVGSNVTFQVKFANQGENPESDVPVKIQVRGGARPITVQEVVEQTTAGAEATVAIPLGQSPPFNVAVTITVEIGKVPGEMKVDNNKGNYAAIFRRG